MGKLTCRISFISFPTIHTTIHTLVSKSGSLMGNYELGFNKALVVFWGRGRLIYTCSHYGGGGWSLCQPILGKSAGTVWTYSQSVTKLTQNHRCTIWSYRGWGGWGERRHFLWGVSQQRHHLWNNNTSVLKRPLIERASAAGCLANREEEKLTESNLNKQKIISHNTWIFVETLFH